MAAKKKQRTVKSDQLKEIAPRCFLDENGCIIFYRWYGVGQKQVVCGDIYNAIWHCFHILDSLLGAVIIDSSGQPKISGTGELADIQEIIKTLQEVISIVTTRSEIAPTELESFTAIFDKWSKKLGSPNNWFKQELRDYLVKMPPLSIGGKPNIQAATVSAAALHVALVRWNDLCKIVNAVFGQAEKLVGIAVSAEERIKTVYQRLDRFKENTEAIMRPNRAEKPSLLEFEQKLQIIAERVAGERSNQIVYALAGIV